MAENLCARSCRRSVDEGQFCFMCSKTWVADGAGGEDLSAGSAGATGPGGGSVETWVQCDGCKAWIHTRCDPRLAKGLQDPQQLKTMKYRYIMLPLLL